MNTVTNDIVIDDSVDRVYGSCVDIERWPSIFESCREVRKTTVSENEIVMEMLVSNELGENRVRSRRRYRPDRHSIDFEMLSLPPALARMDGSWSVEAVDDGTRLVVIHNFERHQDADASAAVLSRKLYDVTARVLADLKAWLENGSSAAEAYGPRTAANAITNEIFERCELFFARLMLGGVDWGDITNVLKDLDKANTFEDWGDWHRRWTALGSRYERRADDAASGGFDETVRQCLLKAAACNHFAEFMYFDEPDTKKVTRAHVTDLFDRALPHLREHVRPVSIPHRDLELPGYLLSPAEDTPRPCVILVNGLDSAKEVELYAFAREFVARGMCVLAFDGPGQGLLAGQVPMVVEFEDVVGAALDVLDRQPEVDERHIGIFGVSFGGYLAARAAAHHTRIEACISLSGGFDHDSYGALNVMVKKDFRYVFGVREDAEMERLCGESLNLRDVPPLQQPLLAIHGELDSIIPFESCLRLMDWAAGEKELLRYPGERHVATNEFGDYIPRFSDWMAERLGVLATADL